VRSVPIDPDLSRCQRSEAPLPRNAGPVVGVGHRPRPGSGGAMTDTTNTTDTTETTRKAKTMTKRGKLLIGTAGAAALVGTLFGLRGGALFGTGPEAQAVAASPVAEPKTIALAPAARDKNPVKVAP